MITGSTEKVIKKAALARLLLILLFVLVSESVALAETAWFTCRVDFAGPGKEFTFVALTDQAEPPAFEKKWFVLSDNQAQAMLAVALTAINADKKVVAVLDPDAGSYPVIGDLYLASE